MKLFYENKVIGTVVTNHSMNVYEALDLAGVDIEDIDPEQVRMAYDAKPYCTQNNGDCGSCSLVNYGRDCENNPVENPIIALAERIYNEVNGADNRDDREEVNEIHDWLSNGDQNFTDFEALVKEWRELQAQAAEARENEKE